MHATQHTIAAALCVLLAACAPAPQADDPQQRRPQQAGQPMDPLRTAGHVTAARMAALTGNQRAMQQHTQAIAEDMRVSMKIPDPARRIPPEAARTAARQVQGVRSANWIDRNNLLVMVDDAAHRTHQVIDLVCLQLEPLGDTLGVVVNLQNRTARNGDELEILSRDCQLQPGDRAFMQAPRQVDALPPEVRLQRRASQAALDDAARNKARDDRENAAALEAIPEM